MNDAQRSAVLKTLGYMPLYDFSYTNAEVHQTINGTPSTNTWVPDWAGNEEKIYLVDVAGWNDKYIRMPEGAQADVLRVVSQGEPTYLTGDTTLDGDNSDGSWTTDAGADGEYVGRYWDYAVVMYTQDRSEYTYDGEEYVDVNAPYLYPGETAQEIHDDLDDSPARWQVTYESDGTRFFELIGDGDSLSMDYVPNWDWDSGGWDTGIDDLNGTNVYSHYGYVQDAASITTINVAGTHMETVAVIQEGYHARWYAMIDEDGDIISPSADSRGPDFGELQWSLFDGLSAMDWAGGSYLATPQTAEQISPRSLRSIMTVRNPGSGAIESGDSVSTTMEDLITGTLSRMNSIPGGLPASPACAMDDDQAVETLGRQR